MLARAFRFNLMIVHFYIRGKLFIIRCDKITILMLQSFSKLSFSLSVCRLISLVSEIEQLEFYHVSIWPRHKTIFLKQSFSRWSASLYVSQLNVTLLVKEANFSVKVSFKYKGIFKTIKSLFMAKVSPKPVSLVWWFFSVSMEIR